MDNQLTRGERIGLWIHLRGCTACRAFARQLVWLRILAQQDATPAPQTMPQDVRDRLNATLTQNRDGSL
jgi:predicted anti-sigma-YlaC factor YlaD